MTPLREEMAKLVVRLPKNKEPTAAELDKAKTTIKPKTKKATQKEKKEKMKEEKARAEKETEEAEAPVVKSKSKAKDKDGSSSMKTRLSYPSNDGDINMKPAKDLDWAAEVAKEEMKVDPIEGNGNEDGEEDEAVDFEDDESSD